MSIETRFSWKEDGQIPPIFIAPAIGMVRWGASFAAVMVSTTPHHPWWGFLLLIPFGRATWIFLRRLERYIEMRTRASNLL